MRNSYPQLLDVLFDNSLKPGTTLLYNIQQHTLEIIKLNDTVKALLPTELRLWCRVANIRQNILVLEVANASLMMRLRYEQPMLLSTLRVKILPSLSSIDIRINPSLITKETDQITCTKQAKKLSYLSPESAIVLKRLANRCPNKLRKILERLTTLAKENIK
ncbi:hypothetical protein SCc_144 [Serratia symbiotica str. 'Cinara cedri']|nr:hypothetical protein SCc_144 [Serratia symbiotica str. 'Cinara cedri']